jgi:hypothetical protein
MQLKFVKQVPTGFWRTLFWAVEAIWHRPSGGEARRDSASALLRTEAASFARPVGGMAGLSRGRTLSVQPRALICNAVGVFGAVATGAGVRGHCSRERSPRAFARGNRVSERLGHVGDSLRESHSEEPRRDLASALLRVRRRRSLGRLGDGGIIPGVGRYASNPGL